MEKSKGEILKKTYIKTLLVELSLALIWGWIYIIKSSLLSSKSITSTSNNQYTQYKSPQCPQWEIMTFWEEYPDWVIKVKKCSTPFSCSKWEELTWYCSPIMNYYSCWLSCLK